MKIRKLLIVLIFMWSLIGCEMLGFPPSNQNKPQADNERTSDESYGVSASHPIAVEEGMKVLKAGGNAVDAAITIAYVLGVVEPYGSGIGGGGGMLILTGESDSRFIDYRETAPKESSILSGIPGFVAGMQYAHDKYGSLPMQELLQPAITYAQEGFVVDQSLSTRLEAAKPRMNSSKLQSYYKEGKALEAGDTLVQPQLAATLMKVQEEGIDGFYKGKIAKSITNTLGISLKELLAYEVEEREPVKGMYGKYDVYTAPPPFSGVTLLQMIKLLENERSYEKVDKIEDYVQELGRVVDVTYKNRFRYSGDPNFVEASTSEKVNEIYIEKLQKELSTKELSEHEQVDVEEHESTTHFVVMDKEGMVVSVTNTLGNFFGSGDFTEGFFLNSQMAQFGSKPNDREEGKRSRTFTAPTILISDTDTIGIGSPGGNRIPQFIAQVLDAYVHGEKSMQTIVNQERFAIEKNVVYTEFLLSKEERHHLEKLGYKTVHKVSPMFYGGVQALIKDKKTGGIQGVGDKRRNGSWGVDK
jgi:gamma-glutamyltranspeptidase / glutathione hydrolase